MGFILVTELGGKCHFSRRGGKNVSGKSGAQWDFAGSPVVENTPSSAGAGLQSLVREPRSCMLGTGKQKETNQNLFIIRSLVKIEIEIQLQYLTMVTG